MLHQRYKDICFLAIAKATLPNYWVRKSFYAVSHKNGHPRHLHIGCGPRYLPGFVNIDANPFSKPDLWLDVRCGLPYANNSVDSVYSTHMIEHLYPDELQKLLVECVRALRQGGGIRFIVPSLEGAIAAYQENRRDWFHESYPRSFDSVGGRFSNFIFCDGQHRAAFDYSYLEEELRKAGFRDVQKSSEGSSRLYGISVPAYEPRDSREQPHSLYVEAFK